MQSDPTNVMDGLMAEAGRLLEEMGRTQDLEIRKVQSETIANLCNSLGVFFDAMNTAWMNDDLLDFDMDDDDEEDGED